jgi:hypothetical protein
MRGLPIKVSVLAVGLLMLAAMPRAASADSYRLDGIPLDSFSIGSHDSFTASMPLGFLADFVAFDKPFSFEIPNLIVDDKTTGTVYDFKDDLVIADAFWLFRPQLGVKVYYRDVEITPTPEPSAMGLLALGLFALGIAARKFRAPKAPAIV